jgi:hypothetical protein
MVLVDECALRWEERVGTALSRMKTHFFDEMETLANLPVCLEFFCKARGLQYDCGETLGLKHGRLGDKNRSSLLTGPLPLMEDLLQGGPWSEGVRKCGNFARGSMSLAFQE